MTEKKPKDRRLNALYRQKLENFARRNLQVDKEHQAYLDVYHEARPLVLALVVDRYPRADMEVLKRYDLARNDSCFHIGNHDSQNKFELRTEDIEEHQVLVPKGNCWERVYTKADRELINLVQKVNLLNDKWHEAKEKKLWHYVQAIRSTSTFNELAAVWPAIEILRDEIVGTEDTPRSKALSILSADTIAFLQQDNAGAAA